MRLAPAALAPALALATAAAAQGPIAIEGQAVQGGLVRGRAPAGTMALLLGDRPVAVAPDGRFLIGFDRETTSFDQAIARKDVVLIDRQSRTAARRSLFGFSVPNFGGLFGGDDDDVKEIESTVTAISRNPEGGYTVRLADGSTWTQTDDSLIALAPRKGDKVKVSKRMLGAFALSVRGQPAVKVRRIG